MSEKMLCNSIGCINVEPHYHTAQGLDYARMGIHSCNQKVVDDLQAALQKAQEEIVRLSGKTGFCAQCNEYAKKADRYREALLSISKNGCCDSCQEAKLVAKSALSSTQAEEKGDQ